MKSVTTAKFKKQYLNLPKSVKNSAQKAYLQFKKNPDYKSLHFKKVHNTEPIYSARINLQYRVIGLKKDNTIIWFWIGPHHEYDHILTQL